MSLRGWVPSWSGQLDDALNTLRQMASPGRTPQQYKAALQALIQSGTTIQDDISNGVTVEDQEGKNWLAQAGALGARIGVPSLVKSAQAGTAQPEGWLADAEQYWFGNPNAVTGQGILETIAVWAVVLIIGMPLLLNLLYPDRR